ncbi:hypothetical protein ACLI4Z_03100 [Natrialbaceae archaeon A-arb3/5]
MERSDDSQIADNRLAASVAVGSLIVLAAVWVLYWVGVLDSLVPAHGPAADAVPLYLLIAVVAIVLVVWSWTRVLSFLR